MEKKEQKQTILSLELRDKDLKFLLSKDINLRKEILYKTPQQALEVLEERLVEKYISKPAENFIEISESFGEENITPKILKRLIKNILPSTLEIECRKSLLKFKTVKGHLYALFLVVAVSGYIFLFRKPSNVHELVGVILFGMLILCVISLIIQLRRISNLSS